MAATGRGPIKVGSGYIEINPRLSEETVRKFRTEMAEEMKKAGRQAGKEFTAATTEGLKGIEKAVRTAAAKAGAAAEAEVKDSAEVIAKIEADLTKQYGEQATKRFRELRKLEEKKRALVEETSKETQAALRATQRQETESLTQAAKAQQQAITRKEKAQAEYEKYVRESNARIAKQEAAEVAASAKQVEAAEKAKQKARRQALEDEARMDREIAATQDRLAREEATRVRTTEREKRAEREQSARMEREIEATRLRLIRENETRIRAELRETQRQRQTMLRTQVTDSQNTQRELRRQLTDYRTQLARVQTQNNEGFTRLQGKFKSVGSTIETLGNHATEAGNLITTKLLAPLGLVAGALTTIGIKSADMRILGQKGLTAAGVDNKTAASEMAQVQQYAIDTPFSVDVMHEYQMKLIRSLAAADPDWYKKATKTQAANQAAGKTTDLIMAVGDSMARAGNLDPSMFQRAMYALDRMSDTDKASTRNISQLVNATGIPAPELAQMFGFNSAGEFWKVVGTPVTKGGGVSGNQMMNNLLQYWDPNYFKKGKDGKPLKDKNGQFIVNDEAHSADGGSKGYGKTMTSATITGRIQQMTEGATNRLGAMFAEPGKNGQYEYTKLGQAFMGKGGVLDEVGDIGKSVLKQLPDLLMAFAEEIKRITGWFKDAANFLQDHPAIKDAIIEIAKIAVVVAPLLIGIGLLSKTIGKLTKIMGVGLSPAKGAFNAVRGSTRVVRQGLAGTRSWANGDSFREGYRDRRTTLRGGDTRGPLTRARDRVTGRNSQADGIRSNMDRVSAQIREAEDRTADLRDRLREVAGMDVDRLAHQLASSGNDSVAGAARDAQQQVRQIQTQGVDPLNRASLGNVRQQFTDTKQAVDKLTAELKNAQTEVTQLDGKKLVQLKVTVDGAHGTVTDLKNKVDDTAHSVVVLNGKKLDALKGEFNHVHDAAEKGYTKVGQGTGGGSLAGRVGLLNGRSLSGLKSQFDKVHDAAERVYSKVGQGTGSGSVAGRIGLLNGRSLKDIRDWFDKVTTAADSAYSKVGQGTGSTSLAGRIGLLNGRSLKDVKGQVDDLKDSLTHAHTAAKNLNTSLDNIADHKSGGSSGGKGKTAKPYTGGIITGSGNVARYATGGVLPGYMPGVDSVPAILSPGEAILRPEVTAQLGAPLIHHWNAMARKGQLSRYAGGGIVNRFGIDKIVDLIHNQNVWPDASAAIKTMAFDATSVPLGGDIQSGMLGAGRSSGRYIGSDMATKFDGIYDFVTKDSWKFLKRLPTVVGQAIGIIGGAFAPTLGEYFHDDVWKGNGNIVERGERFLGDTFSTNTLTSVFDDLFGGVWDSVKSLVGGAKDLITDPVGSVTKTIDALWTVGTGEINQIIDMVKAVKSFAQSPKDYAMTVLSDVYATGKEALPNTKGLFDFSNDDKVNATKPSDIAAKYSLDDPPGKGVTRWKPTVQRVLKELGLAQSYTDLVLHRIQVESGGNPKAINNWDSNAKAGYPSQGLMQTIPQTFAAYAGPYKSLGITNGLASIYAGLNYAVHRYGSGWPKALSGTKGYWTGTASASPGLALVGERGPELIDFSGGERVYNDQDTAGILGGKKYEIHIHEAKSENSTQAVLRAMQYAEALYGGL
ncbi:transglycosylase SLT domain-containing protein [Streptomyces scabiei]|uniref:transglycosylase SLT domain-containing protein n=1 Tax=Streptomyces scabiei TaxID=1930 RepID=UPI0038F6383A